MNSIIGSDWCGLEAMRYRQHEMSISRTSPRGVPRSWWYKAEFNPKASCDYWD